MLYGKFIWHVTRAVDDRIVFDPARRMIVSISLIFIDSSSGRYCFCFDWILQRLLPGETGGHTAGIRLSLCQCYIINIIYFEHGAFYGHQEAAPQAGTRHHHCVHIVPAIYISSYKLVAWCHDAVVVGSRAVKEFSRSFTVPGEGPN